MNVQGGGLCITSGRDVLPARFLANLPLEAVHRPRSAGVPRHQLACGVHKREKVLNILIAPALKGLEHQLDDGARLVIPRRALL